MILDEEGFDLDELEDATLDDYSSSSASSSTTSSLISSDDEQEGDEEDEEDGKEEPHVVNNNKDEKKEHTTHKRKTSDATPDHIVISSESLTSILNQRKTKSSKVLLSEYRSALLKERSERMTLQDLAYTQMKKLQKLQNQLQLNNEALSDLAVRNMSLEEELGKMRVANENAETVTKVTERKKTSLKISNLFGMKNKAQQDNNDLNSSSMSNSYSASVSMDRPPSPPMSSDPMKSSTTTASTNTSSSFTMEEESPRDQQNSSPRNGNGKKKPVFGAFGKEKNSNNNSSSDKLKRGNLEDKIQQLEKQIEQMQKNEKLLTEKARTHEASVSYMQSQVRVTRDMLQDTQGQLSKALEQCKLLTVEHTKSTTEIDRLKSLISDQHIAIESLKQEVITGQENLAHCKEDVAQEFTGKMESLNQVIEEKNTTIQQMSEKLMALKDQLNNVRLQLRKHSVKHLHKLRPKTDAVIVLHKNPMNNVFMLDVLEAKSGKVVVTYPLTFISDVKKDTSHLNRFCLIFSNQSVEWFETPNCSEVVNSIKEFLTFVAT